MEQVTLHAEKRAEGERGTGVAKKLRVAGKVPGVVYGLGRETLPFTVERHHLFEMLDRAKGGNILIRLDLAGTETDTDVAALLKEIQWSPVHKEPLNVDLQWISLTDPVVVSVDLTVEGEAAGIEEGGSINQLRYEVEIECLPGDIPEELVIDVTGMEIADTRYAEDIAVPEGVTLLLDADEAVVTIARPITEEDLEVRIEEELLAAGIEELALEEGELTPEEMEEEADVEELEEGEEGEEGEEAAEDEEEGGDEAE